MGADRIDSFYSSTTSDQREEYFHVRYSNWKFLSLGDSGSEIYNTKLIFKEVQISLLVAIWSNRNISPHLIFIFDYFMKCPTNVQLFEICWNFLGRTFSHDWHGLKWYLLLFRPNSDFYSAYFDWSSLSEVSEALFSNEKHDAWHPSSFSLHMHVIVCVHIKQTSRKFK